MVKKDSRTPVKRYETRLKKARAEIYFVAFYEIKDSRSIRKLWENVRELGGRISLKTLERYHREYHWAQRVMELDAKAEAVREKELVDGEVERRRFQQRLGHNLSILGQAGIMEYQKLLSSKKFPKLPPADICRFVEIGQKVENLASGDATSRCDMTVNVWNVLVAQIARAFLEVNTLRDEAMRRRRFAIKVDEIKDQHLPALMEGDYEVISE